MTADLPLSGRKALVTGASKGIGGAIAVALAQAGADVAVNYNRDEAGALATVEAVRSAGRLALPLQANVGEPEQVSRMFAWLRENAGWRTLDILVNNAGISPAKPFGAFSVAELLEVVAVNLTGAMLCAQEALPGMAQAGYGRIINVSSVHSMANNPGRVPYAASKGGMNAMTRAIAVEFGPRGISANSLVVGAVAVDRTGMDRLPPEQAALWRAAIPTGRWGTPEDIARLAVFLADERSSFINGASIAIDGGNLSLVPHP